MLRERWLVQRSTHYSTKDTPDEAKPAPLPKSCNRPAGIAKDDTTTHCRRAQRRCGDGHAIAEIVRSSRECVREIDAAAAPRVALAPTVLCSAPRAFPAPQHTREMVTFLPFLLMGLVPPFSPFFMAALEEYGLHMVHLTPNAILTLTLFAHACEVFVG